MATNAFIVHRGNLDGDEELTGSLGLADGQKLFVASSNDAEIVLRRTQERRPLQGNPEEVLQLWDTLCGSFTSTVAWTPEWHAEAMERKRKATQNLERVQADPGSPATDVKRAEREWELADDELDFGPFRDR